MTATRSTTKKSPTRPQSTLTCYKSNRWTGFLNDIQQESNQFGEIVKNGSIVKEKNDQEFKQTAQKSFNAIHNVKRKKADPNKMVPRQKRRQIKSLNAKDKNQFHHDMRLANYSNWPLRATSPTKRILSPIRLGDYPNMKRPMDVPTMLGEPVANPIIL